MVLNRYGSTLRTVMWVSSISCCRALSPIRATFLTEWFIFLFDAFLCVITKSMAQIED